LEKIAFLGHIFTVEGIEVDPSKVEAVSKWRQPSWEWQDITAALSRDSPA
jgi:hypothetical protein